ncbi:Golgi SNAP receptor complex member 2 [Macrosteles quadrilineatus]|uniref:Golgi SNAP receptor complex member 2 n=1 Tax=Macrosteles quadrilineatus TaxID=74068 RepID=UPI0023E1B7A3|nr:Golgi SNAP receptor complex member 2 [Macrosteles quadrilineatus]XP_054271516.1 Golgi SNAP receptor complex member 2 [Macrosteles quadrilineatus]XP_054271517.1 Golgi SNAP receptor complex member 2 [Macrosteles quadrilineatus]XP_054271518.1 Golgi SNAP receptor complex member 2 [Macrosteles quadrilineatus]
MEALYHQTNRLLQETQQCFQDLSFNRPEVEKEIQARIDQITSNCEKLDIMVHKEPISRRQNAKIRVDQLKYDNQHLQAALRSHQHEVYRRQQEEREREELLSRRFTHTDHDTSIIIDHSLQHNTALQNSNRGVDDMLRTGSGILESLRDQRNTLKGAQRRIMDIANTLGLSNTTMRLIERRAHEDKYILFGGMVITLLIIVLVIIYLT